MAKEKLKKVIKGLQKASKTHAKQAEIFRRGKDAIRKKFGRTK